MASSISAFVFMTNGPPLAIGSPIGLPDINKNLDLIRLKTFNFSSLFNKIKAGSKGGKPGQWSARKAQMLAKQYKAKGGGYKS